MATTISTATGISQRTNVWAAAEMLDHANEVIVLDKMAKNITMPKNKSVNPKWRRPVPFTAKTTALTEGVTPSSSSMTYEDVTATLRQYGDFSVVTDVIADTHEDPVLKDMTMLHGENIGRTREALLWGVLKGGTSVYYANGSARNAVNTVISINRQRGVTRYLKAMKGRKISRILDGSPDLNTTPIESAYVAVGHTDLEADIRGLSGFVPAAEYGTRKLICAEEIGSVEDVRYVLSPDLDPLIDAGGTKGSMVSTGGTNADVYPILYLAMDAFGVVALKGAGSVEPSIIPVGEKTKDDPLAQRGYVGWKTWWAGLILNETWIVRMEVAASDLA